MCIFVYFHCSHWTILESLKAAMCSVALERSIDSQTRSSTWPLPRPRIDVLTCVGTRFRFQVCSDLPLEPEYMACSILQPMFAVAPVRLLPIHPHILRVSVRHRWRWLLSTACFIPPTRDHTWYVKAMHPRFRLHPPWMGRVVGSLSDAEILA